MERGELFEDPLQEALDKEHLGEITGGGSQLSDPDESGTRLNFAESMLIFMMQQEVLLCSEMNSYDCERLQALCCVTSSTGANGKSPSIAEKVKADPELLCPDHQSRHPQEWHVVW